MNITQLALTTTLRNISGAKQYEFKIQDHVIADGSRMALRLHQCF